MQVVALQASRVDPARAMEVVSRTGGGNYIAGKTSITPKLLPDLKYERLMKVLSVNNGEWLSEDHTLGNMMNMIHDYVAKRRSSAVASM